MSEKEKQLELLNRLFDAARGNLDEEWTDEAYVLADLIKLVDTPAEIAIRELITEDAIDTIHNTYKIPRSIASRYFKETPEVMDNTMDRIYETILTEIEDWLPSTDILSHQAPEKKDLSYGEYMS